MDKKFEIWCKTTNENGKKVMIWCKTIYQKWDEEDYPFRRRAKRIFKQYKEKNAAEDRIFYLIEE